MGGMNESWTPPPGWRAAFEKQATDELIERASRYARQRAKLVGRVARRNDPLYARELVQDALIDTLDGRVVWDPERVSLLTHVMGVIQSRTRHHVVRAIKMPHRSLDDSADDHSTEGRPVEREASLAVVRERGADPDDPAYVAHAARVVGGLWQSVGDSGAARELLRAYEQGKTERHEVMELTGMSAATYKNERRRIVRLAAKLPAEVREPAVEALR